MQSRERYTRGLVPLTLAAALLLCGGGATAQDRPAEVAGRPNLNGIWQAVNTAYWNVEGQSTAAIDDFWELGALFAIPPGQSVVEGGALPYTDRGLEQRAENRAGWPDSDPEAKCFRAGVPRSTYLPYPFEIIQGDGDILLVYEYATSNRIVRMKEHASPDEILVDQYLGWSNGHWEGETLVIEVFGLLPGWLDRVGNHHAGSVTERYTLMDKDHIWYEATVTDLRNFSRPFTIAMPLYRRVEPNAEIYEYKCVELAEPMLYGELLKEPIE